jgi:membrane protein
MAQGRTADTPASLSGAAWKKLALRVKDQIAEDRVGLLAAGVAFYGLLALFPAITAIVAIGGLLVEPSQIVDQLDRLSGLMPQEALAIITRQATSVAGSSPGGLGLAAAFGLLFALYSASKGMASLMQGLNVVFGVEEDRGFLKRLLVTLTLTLLLIGGLLLAVAASLAVPAFVSFADLGTGMALAVNAALWLGLVAMTILGLSILYRFAPAHDAPRWRWTSIGAVMGCFVWIAASGGFAFYVSNFGTYNESFGALAGVIVMLLWFWISAYVILLGAEVNSELDRMSRQSA